jgi:hypothetical protein
MSYIPPPNNNLPFNFSSSGYTPPDFNDIRFRYPGAITDLKMAITGSELQRDYIKECKTYVLGYNRYNVQILRQSCTYGGIRDLAVDLFALNNFLELEQYIKSTVQEYSDINEIIRGWKTENADISEIIKVWKREVPTDLHVYLKQGFADSTNLSAYLHTFQRSETNIKALIKSWFIEAKFDLLEAIKPTRKDLTNIPTYIKSTTQQTFDLQEALHGWAEFDLLEAIKPTHKGVEDIFTYIKSKINQTYDLPTEVYKIWQHSNLNLQKTLYGWAVLDLNFLLQAFNYSDIGASIRSTYMNDLAVFLQTIQPVDLPADIYGWAVNNLLFSTTIIKSPWDFQFFIEAIPPVNLPMSLKVRKAVASPFDLNLNVSSYYRNDLSFFLNTVSGADLNMLLTASGQVKNLLFKIYPKVVYVKTFINVSYLENKDLGFMVNYPCYGSDFRNLSFNLFSSFSSNMRFNVFGTDGSNIKDLSFKVNHFEYVTQDYMTVKAFNNPPIRTKIDVYGNNEERPVTTDYIGVSISRTGYSGTTYYKDPALLGIDTAKRYVEEFPPSSQSTIIKKLYDFEDSLIPSEMSTTGMSIRSTPTGKSGNYSIGSDGSSNASAILSPEELWFGKEIDRYEYYYYVDSLSSDYPILSAISPNGNRLFTTTIRDDGALIRHHNGSWEALDFQANYVKHLTLTIDADLIDEDLIDFPVPVFLYFSFSEHWPGDHSNKTGSWEYTIATDFYFFAGVYKTTFNVYDNDSAEEISLRLDGPEIIDVPAYSVGNDVWLTESDREFIVNQSGFYDIKGRQLTSSSYNWGVDQVYIDSKDIDSSNGRWFFEYIGEDKLKLKVETEEGEQCYVEIESWDFVNRKAIIYVKVPFISSSVDTVLTLTVDPSMADNVDYVGETGSMAANNVWDNNFIAVYHMNQDPSISGAYILDSTSNDNYSTPIDTMSSGSLINADFGKALSFDGISDFISTPDDESFDIINNLTVETRIKPNTIGAGDIYVAKYATGEMEWALRNSSISGTESKISVAFGNPLDGSFEGMQETYYEHFTTTEYQSTSFTFSSGIVNIFHDGDRKESNNFYTDPDENIIDRSSWDAEWQNWKYDPNYDRLNGIDEDINTNTSSHDFYSSGIDYYITLSEKKKINSISAHARMNGSEAFYALFQVKTNLEDDWYDVEDVYYSGSSTPITRTALNSDFTDEVGFINIHFHGNDRSIYLYDVSAIQEGELIPTTLNNGDAPLTIGNGGTGQNYPSNVSIAEVRVSDVARSDAWLKATNYSLKNELLTMSSVFTFPHDCWYMIRADFNWSSKKADIKFLDVTNNYVYTVDNTDINTYSIDVCEGGTAYSFPNKGSGAIRAFDNNHSDDVYTGSWRSSFSEQGRINPGNEYTWYSDIFLGGLEYLYVYAYISDNDNFWIKVEARKISDGTWETLYDAEGGSRTVIDTSYSLEYDQILIYQHDEEGNDTNYVDYYIGAYTDTFNHVAIGYDFTESKILKKFRIRRRESTTDASEFMPYTFEIRGSENRPVTSSGFITEGDILYSADEYGNDDYWKELWHEYDLDNPTNKSYNTCWLVCNKNQSGNPFIVINEIEILGIIEDSDYSVESFDIDLHDIEQSGTWGNGFEGTSGNFYIDNILINHINYREVIDNDITNLPFNISGELIPVDLNFSLRSYINRNYKDPSTKKRTVVLKLNEGIEDWRRYVELTFRQYAQRYYYFSGNQTAYKEFRDEHWEVKVEGYSLSDLPLGVERSKFRKKYLFNLNRYDSIDSAIRDMIDRVTSYKEFDMNFSVLPVHDNSKDLNISIKTRRIYKSNRVLGINITAI